MEFRESPLENLVIPEVRDFGNARTFMRLVVTGLDGYIAGAARRCAIRLFEMFEQSRMTAVIFEFSAYTGLEQLRHLLRTRRIDDEFFCSPRDFQGYRTEKRVYHQLSRRVKS